MPELDRDSVTFSADIEGDIAADHDDLVEVTAAPSPDHNPPSPRSPSRIDPKFIGLSLDVVNNGYQLATPLWVAIEPLD